MRPNVLVASGAFWVNFCLLGVLRSNAVIYRALVDVYEVEREGAAWPSGIFGFFMCVTGVLSGFLTYYVSLRSLAMLGVLLASCAVSSSCLASNLNQIVYLYGALQGIGVGLVVPLTHVILNQNFAKYRALALGIAYSGSSAGSFLFPPLTAHFLQRYGLQGTFLLLGGIMLNALLGAMLFRSPRQPQPKKASPRCRDRTAHASVISQGDSSISRSRSTKITNVGIQCADSRSPGWKLAVASKLTRAKNGETDKNSLKNICSPKLVSSATIAAEVLLSPHFFIVSAAYAVYFSTSAIFLMVVLDFAQERGVPMQEGVFLVSAFSFGDCAGRLSFGWIADTQIVPRNVLVRFYLLAMGLVTGLLPFCPTASMLAVSIILGLLNGSVIVNHSVLLNEYLGIDKLPIAVGFSMFFIGMSAMLRPLVIGLFRDGNGSYNHLFIFIGFIQVLITSIWFLASIVHAILRRHLCANKTPK